MANATPLDVEDIRQRFNYDPESGLIIFKDGRRAGSPAGHLCANGHLREAHEVYVKTAIEIRGPFARDGENLGRIDIGNPVCRDGHDRRRGGQ